MAELGFRVGEVVSEWASPHRLNVLLISVIKLTADNSTSAELYKGVCESLFFTKEECTLLNLY